MSVPVVLSDDAIERIAERAASIAIAAISPTMTARVSPYLTVSEAAEWARCSRQRIYDLLSARRLRRYRDGSRVLIRHDELEGWLTSDGTTRRTA
jgi:excisionase family DNA binding protein